MTTREKIALGITALEGIGLFIFCKWYKKATLKELDAMGFVENGKINERKIRQYLKEKLKGEEA